MEMLCFEHRGSVKLDEIFQLLAMLFLFLILTKMIFKVENARMT